MEINKANELVVVVFPSHVREDVVNMLDTQLVIDMPFAIHVVDYQPYNLQASSIRNYKISPENVNWKLQPIELWHERLGF